MHILIIWADSIAFPGRYSEGEIHFNLMALVPDRKMLWQKEIEKLQSQPISPDVQSELQRLLALCDDEDCKRKRQKIENIRRKHNYLPMIVQLLRMLAEKGQLQPLYEKAKQRAILKSTAPKSGWIKNDETHPINLLKLLKLLNQSISLS